jgi:hypothetical protein
MRNTMTGATIPVSAPGAQARFLNHGAPAPHIGGQRLIDALHQRAKPREAIGANCRVMRGDASS